jgi:hypothetical protein
VLNVILIAAVIAIPAILPIGDCPDFSAARNSISSECTFGDSVIYIVPYSWLNSPPQASTTTALVGYNKTHGLSPDFEPDARRNHRHSDDHHT